MLCISGLPVPDRQYETVSMEDKSYDTLTGSQNVSDY